MSSFSFRLTPRVRGPATFPLWAVAPRPVHARVAGERQMHNNLYKNDSYIITVAPARDSLRYLGRSWARQGGSAASLVANCIVTTLALRIPNAGRRIQGQVRSGRRATIPRGARGRTRSLRAGNAKIEDLISRKSPLDVIEPITRTWEFSSAFSSEFSSAPELLAAKPLEPLVKTESGREDLKTTALVDNVAKSRGIAVVAVGGLPFRVIRRRLAPPLAPTVRLAGALPAPVPACQRERVPQIGLSH